MDIVKDSGTPLEPTQECDRRSGEKVSQIQTANLM